MMQAISLWQPWSSLLVASDPANGGRPPKELETRHWPAPATIRGSRIAIHATSSVPAPERARLIYGGEFVEPYRSILLRCGFSIRDPWERGYSPTRGLWLNTGAIVGSVVVVDSIPVDNVPGTFLRLLKAGARDPLAAGDVEIALGDFTPGRYAWRLIDAVRLDRAIRARGERRLWPVGPDVEPAIRRAVALASRKSGLAGNVVR